MPVSFDICPDTGIVRTKATGHVSTGEMVAHIHALASLENGPRPHRELWDGRGISKFTVSASAARDLIEMARAREFFHEARVAAVSDDEFVYKMTQVAELFSTAVRASHQFRSFRDHEQARAWLLSASDS